MNKTILTLALAGALITSARAQSPLSDLSVAGTFDYESQYIFRGQKITNSAFQPKIEFGYPVYGGSLYAGIWNNDPVTYRSSGASGKNLNGVGSSPTEVDIYGGYIYPLDMLTKGLSVDVGYTFYWYPSGHNFTSSSNETYIGFSYDTTSVLGGINLNPSLYYYHDWSLDANTVEASIKYTWVLDDMVGVKGVSLVPRGYAGYENIGNLSGGQVAGAPSLTYWYWGINLDLNYKINDYVTAFGGVRYAGNSADPNSLRLGHLSTENIWGGLGLKFSK